MITIVPNIIKSVFHEGQLFFTAKDVFDKKSNELAQLICQVGQSLEQVEYFNNIQEDLYTNEQKQLIMQCNDHLHQSESLLQSLPSHLTLINGYFYSKSNNYKELVQSIEELVRINNQLHELELQSLEILKTVVIPNFSRKQSFQCTQFSLSLESIYEIQIVLKLKAPKLVKEIFDQYPRHLKSEYKFKIQMEDAESHKNVFHFQRMQFLKLQQMMKEVKIYTLSKNKHCSLEIRNSLQYSHSTKNTFIPDTKFISSEIISMENLQQDQENKSNLLKLFLVQNGQNGTTVIRNQRTPMHVGIGQECELFEKDQIVILQDSNQDPLISYVVQLIMIKL
ncbi:unnamed protein product (macronuclear) [Paramecium tetraurelia]|uniref:Uncharacterized protein n=1 Tax=Paramecium tetraurelia TaxID=5888 RepID=A0DPW7_PARTE|nr:uncharacterized protein GSPATT00002483001 [Paramecium tetraurelia]CAK85084.1 unnamed protein product [Paramecium tetraurelia]|eukprot:XP_001452481.1 hypothetical protein (macronuclear) [Paramecium tetraurelia strain d4-2]